MMDVRLLLGLGTAAILLTTVAIIRPDVETKTAEEEQDDTTEWNKKPIDDTNPQHIRIARSTLRFVSMNSTQRSLKAYNKITDYPMYSPNSIEFNQYLHLVCDLPRSANYEIWNKKGVVNMVFNVSTPQVMNSSTVYIKTATLKLFKQNTCAPQLTKEKIDNSPNCRPDKTSEQRSNVQMTTAELKNMQIVVSVFAYTPGFKNTMRKILLDTLMLPYLGDKWTQFNVRTAVKNWRENPADNLGLCIEVNDERGNKLQAKKFFQSMNCVKNYQTTTPIPENVSNTEAQLMANFYTLQRYPVMIIENVESPATEVHNSLSQQFAKKAFEEYLKRNASRSNNQNTENKP